MQISLVNLQDSSPTQAQIFAWDSEVVGVVVGVPHQGSHWRILIHEPLAGRDCEDRRVDDLGLHLDLDLAPSPQPAGPARTPRPSPCQPP